MSHRLRVTPEPTVVREVDDAELVDLARQGLIHSYEHTPEALAVLDAHHISLEVARWKSADQGEEVVTAPDPLAAPAPVTDNKKKGA